MSFLVSCKLLFFASSMFQRYYTKTVFKILVVGRLFFYVLDSVIEYTSDSKISDDEQISFASVVIAESSM